MAVYCFQPGNVQLEKFADAEVYLKDVVDASLSTTLDAGWGRYKKGTALEWTLDYDEVFFVTEGVMTIRTAGKAHTAKAGEFFFITRGTPVVYQADEDVRFFYVTYPHWREAAHKAGRL
jgi:ethanolamine utilization protein EutQ (cupin superfamily)